jgi:cytochrome oxidase Cu insertion factor (SCO1/SenC/PrrC family)
VKRVPTWRYLGAGLVLGIAVGAALFVWPGPLATVAGAPAPLPRLFQAPTYQLVDQLDRPVHSADFLGKVRIVVTMDPYCTTLCPLTASKVRNLEQVLKRRHLAHDVQFVAFDIDKMTGPKDLRAFLDQEGVNPDVRWLAYLTGPAKTVRSVVHDGYHSSYYSVSNAQAQKLAPSTFQARMSNGVAEKANAPFAIMHQSPLFVVDRQGWVRAVYGDASTTPSAVVVNDVAQLVGGAG